MRFRATHFGLALTLFFATASVTSANNIVANSGFELGYAGFSSDYALMFGGTGTPDNVNSCVAAATIAVAPGAQECHSSWSAFGDHTSGNGLMLIVNGAPSPGASVWTQTVEVSPFTTYLFTAFVASVHSANPAALLFSINGSQLGEELELSNEPGLWVSFSRLWQSGELTTATLAISDANLRSHGNDFALDDISFAASASSIAAVSMPEASTLVLLGLGLTFVGRRLRRSNR